MSREQPSPPEHPPELPAFAGAAAYRKLDMSEPATTPVEILHHPTTDIILNRTAKLADWAPRLAEVCRDGLPDTWQADPKGYDQPHILLGEVDGKQFMAKIRTKRPGAAAMAQIRSLPADQANTPVLHPDFTKRDWYAFESITSEIRLAPRITAALNQEPIQKLVRDYGCTGISYVEPIIGIIDKTPADEAPNTKSIVYEYMADADELWSSSLWSDDPQEANKEMYGLTQAVESALSNAGINPTDLHPRQLLINSQNRLYLIDTEAYTAHAAL